MGWPGKAEKGCGLHLYKMCQIGSTLWVVGGALSFDKLAPKLVDVDSFHYPRKPEVPLKKKP